MWGRASQKVLRKRRVNSRVAEDFVSFLRDERRSSSSEVIGDCPKEEGGLMKWAGSLLDWSVRERSLVMTSVVRLGCPGRGRLEAPWRPDVTWVWVTVEVARVAIVVSSELVAGKKTEEARSTFSGVSVWIVAMARESSHCLILGFPLDKLSMRLFLLISVWEDGLTEFSSEILNAVGKVNRLDWIWLNVQKMNWLNSQN